MPWEPLPLEYYGRDPMDCPVLGHHEHPTPFRLVKNSKEGDWCFSFPPWLTQHGKAMVKRDINGAIGAWDVLHPDGRRFDCRRSNSYWRRRSDDGRGWVRCHVRITPEEVHLEENSFRPPMRWSHEPSLMNLLMKNPRIMQLIQDDWFAQEVVVALDGPSLLLDGGKAPVILGSDDARGLVADLRGLQEHYVEMMHIVWKHPGISQELAAAMQFQVREELNAAGVRMTDIES